MRAGSLPSGVAFATSAIMTVTVRFSLTQQAAAWALGAGVRCRPRFPDCQSDGHRASIDLLRQRYGLVEIPKQRLHHCFVTRGGFICVQVGTGWPYAAGAT